MVEHQTADVAFEADVGDGVLKGRNRFVDNQLSSVDRYASDPVGNLHLVADGTVHVAERLQILHRFGFVRQLGQIHSAESLRGGRQLLDHIDVGIESTKLRCLLGRFLGIDLDLFVHIGRRRRRRLVLYTDGRGGLDVVGGEHDRPGEGPRRLNFDSFFGTWSAEEITLENQPEGQLFLPWKIPAARQQQSGPLWSDCNPVIFHLFAIHFGGHHARKTLALCLLSRFNGGHSQDEMEEKISRSRRSSVCLDC